MAEARAADADRIHAWIQREAAEKTPAEIREYVEREAQALFQAPETFTPTELLSHPGGDEWSPLDVLGHVTGWCWQIGEDVLHTALTGERPGNPLPEFAAEPDLLRSKYREALDSVWVHVSEADPAGFLEISWEHPFLGPFNWREWYLFLGAHAYDHRGQLVAMKQALDA